MNKILVSTALLSLQLLSFSCGKDNNGSEPVPPAPPVPEEPKPAAKTEIKISASVKDTRATDFGFESGDKIGIYVVNYSGTTPGSLKTSGNHVDNMFFIYSGEWTPSSPIYWLDSTTHTDFYLYYPYNASISSVDSYPFELKSDQSKESDYKSCDFMIGKSPDIAPTNSSVNIEARHLMSRMVISLEAGNGFTKESLQAADISVRINGLRTKSFINIADATVTATGDPAVVIPFKDMSAYKAIVTPQTVGETNLISVTVDGREFNLRKAFTFESGKSHNFSVTLSKTSNGINVNINPWD
nr:fimbrillin family protein [Muribaculaceae bacterium]